MPKFYLDTEEKGKGYIVGWMGRLQKTRDWQNNRKGGSATPPIEGDDFSFAANGAVVQPSILQVQKPSDRLGDFTVVRASDATYVDSSGVIQTAPDNIARIDYTNGVAELLTEPQSTNTVLYSEPTVQEVTDIEVSYALFDWANGFTNCVYFGDNSVRRIRNVGSTVAGDWSMSVYVIMDDLSKPSIGNASNHDFNIRVDNSVTTEGVDETILDMGNNIWRVSKKITSTGVNPNHNGVVKETAHSVKGFRVVGWQLEQLGYTTSYIKTEGASVTRLADTITNGANVNVINSEEGTLFFEGSALFDDTGENRYLSLSDGTENNVINISYNTNGALIQFLINAGGALILSHAQPTVDITTNAKIAVKWKVNDFAIWINGAEVDTVLSGVVPTGLNSVNLSNAVGANYFNSRTRELKVYDRVLTTEELEEITTL